MKENGTSPAIISVILIMIAVAGGSAVMYHFQETMGEVTEDNYEVDFELDNFKYISSDYNVDENITLSNISENEAIKIINYLEGVLENENKS